LPSVLEKPKNKVPNQLSQAQVESIHACTCIGIIQRSTRAKINN
jgi:hypothetical protein